MKNGVKSFTDVLHCNCLGLQVLFKSTLSVLWFSEQNLSCIQFNCEAQSQLLIFGVMSLLFSEYVHLVVQAVY